MTGRVILPGALRAAGFIPLESSRAPRVGRPRRGYGFTSPRATARSAASALVETSIFS